MSIVIGDLKLKLTLEYDDETKEIKVKSYEQDFEKHGPIKLDPEERKINNTEAKYFIITYGSNAFAGELPAGQSITIRYNGKDYTGKVHSSVKGRVDALSNWYKEEDIKEGDVIRAKYTPEEKLMEIEKIKKGKM